MDEYCLLQQTLSIIPADHSASYESVPSTGPSSVLTPANSKRESRDNAVVDEGTRLFQEKVQDAFTLLASNSSKLASNSSYKTQAALIGRINESSNLILQFRKEFRMETDADYKSFLIMSIDDQKNIIDDLKKQINHLKETDNS
jgi:hypothetical protein